MAANSAEATQRTIPVAKVPDTDLVEVLALRGTDIGFRPIKLTQAYLLTDDNRHVLSPFVRPNAFSDLH